MVDLLNKSTVKPRKAKLRPLDPCHMDHMNVEQRLQSVKDLKTKLR